MSSRCARRLGWGSVSKSTASRICAELRERFEAFKRRDLYDIQLVALFLDATFIAGPPERPQGGRAWCAWGFTENGERVLVVGEAGDARVLRGLAEPRPRPDRPRARRADADRRRRRARADQGDRAVLAARQTASAAACTAPATSTPSSPSRERERVKHAYWRALDEAISERTPSTDSKPWSTSSTRVASPPRRGASPTTSTRSSCICATRSGTADGGGQRTCSSDRSVRSSGAPR